MGFSSRFHQLAEVFPAEMILLLLSHPLFLQRLYLFLQIEVNLVFTERKLKELAFKLADNGCSNFFVHGGRCYVGTWH